jgi:hypothetical protein
MLARAATEARMQQGKIPNGKRFRLALEHRTSERSLGSDVEPLEPAPLSPETIAFLEEHQVPAALREFLEQHSYNQSITLGELVFDAVNEMPEENLDNPNVSCIRHRLFIVGSGATGDPIAVDLENGLTVGYVFHDQLWDDDHANARDLFVATPFDLGTFFHAAATHVYDEETDRGFPADAYSAQEQDEHGWDEFEPDENGPRA